jgi:hypothetical protein
MPTVHEELMQMTAWFSENVTRAGDGCAIDHHTEFSRRPIRQILDDLQTGEAAIMCGGMALLMQSCAAEIGIDTIGLNFGSNGTGPTHVVVAAKQETGEYALYDPMFGLSLLDEDGKPADIESIVGRLNDRRLHEVRLRRLGRRRVRFTFFRESLPFVRQIDPQVSCSELPDDRVICWINLDRYGAWFARRIKHWLRTSIERPSILDFLRFPISTSGEADAKEIASLLSR